MAIGEMFGTVMDEVFDLVIATWTDIDFAGRDTQETRINFLDLARTAQEGGEEQIVCPFAIIGCDPSEDEQEYGLDNDAKRLPVRIYYIAKPTVDTIDIAGDVMAKLEALRLALIAGDDDMQFKTFQLVENPDCDISQHSEANMLFASNGWSFFAGCLTVKVLCFQTLGGA